MIALKPLDGKDLVAAILLFEDKTLHIDDITHLVMECGLSTLGLKAEEPRQSVSPVLTLNWERFERYRTGRYRIADRTLSETNEEVKIALEQYRAFRLEAGKSPSTDTRISTLLAELATKERRCRELESKLKQVSEIVGN